MRLRTAMAILALACCTVGVCVPAAAQDIPNPKADLFVGYSYLKPDLRGDPLKLPAGIGSTLTYNFTNHFGLSADYAFGQSLKRSYHDQTFMFGPKITWQAEKARPFVEFLIGGNHTRAGSNFRSNGVAFAVGGGVDLLVARHFGFRIFRVDDVVQKLSDGTDNGFRFQTGLLFAMGGAPALVPAASCSVSPTEVLAGEPVTATANASQFNPKHTLKYGWTTSGGKASGQAATTQIDTAGLAPGTYKVSSHVAGKGKEFADCSSSFTVKEPPKHPPTITCSANPSTVEAGQAVAIQCTGASEDKRPLTYTWQSSAGNIAGTDANGNLTTTGVTGPVTVTTTVTDDRGLSANTTTNVTVQAPPPPPPPPPVNQVKQDLDTKGKALLDVHFDTDKATIRPESEKILTDSATVLKEEPDLSVYVDGYTDSTGTKAHNLVLSRRRAASVVTWLTEHGVEKTRLAARGFGQANPVGDNKTVEGKQANRRVELVKMTDAEKAKAAAAPKKIVRKKKATTTTTTTTTTTKKK